MSSPLAIKHCISLGYSKAAGAEPIISWMLHVEFYLLFRFLCLGPLVWSLLGTLGLCLHNTSTLGEGLHLSSPRGHLLPSHSLG